MRLFATTALVVLTSLPALAQEWKADYQTVNIGFLSGENEQDRLTRTAPLKAHLEKTLGVKVEIFLAGNYDGVIQAMAADQIEFAFHGSSSYAAAYTATDGKIIPLLTAENKDGSTGYYSIIAVRCDSGLTSLDDLKGKTLAFADPDSTSGYAVPYFNLVKQGYEPKEFFGATPFSGSHEAGVQGVVNGTFDAAATWQNTELSGVYQRMELKGMIDPGQVCSIWKSPEITSGPLTARANLPEAMIEAVTAAVESFPSADPEGWAFYNSTDADDDNPTVGYVRVDHERYQWIIDMRAWLKTQRRG
ncbi:MAG: phosphonate ABC transporter substrate-binding protein [Hoeflea sp.]|uniref:phosphonate ABC transporter substrate-binding protein n=1 Tax=Hoeflea sp. TaxID=1940281 RepID=UPI002730041E|nr:phosphonate ABC transporter substrate-binding protein [Hoeflea sp.]MDP2118561.1 phosphonate ABC transporter substrate-binding protein [Hoeflea sp.]